MTQFFALFNTMQILTELIEKYSYIPIPMEELSKIAQAFLEVSLFLPEH